MICFKKAALPGDSAITMIIDKDIVMRVLIAVLFYLPAYLLAATTHALFQAAPVNPYALFGELQKKAHSSEVTGHDYAVLGTLDENGYPQLRLVYVDFKNDLGYSFSSHENASKTKQLSKNPKASLLYSWIFKDNIHMQIRITGNVTPLGKTNAASSDVEYLLKPSHLAFSVMEGTKDKSVHYYMTYTLINNQWTKEEKRLE